MAYTQEYYQEALKQKGYLTQKMISLGNFVTGGKASEAGAKYAEKYPEQVQYWQTGVLGSKFAITEPEDAIVREKLTEQGTAVYQQEVIQPEQFRDLRTTPTTEAILKAISEPMTRGVHENLETAGKVGFGAILGALLVVAVLLYIIFKGGLFGKIR